MSAVSRARALLAELDQALADVERELADNPKRARKRPQVKVDEQPSQQALDRVRRGLRRQGVAA
jgi:hypothetical protein